MVGDQHSLTHRGMLRRAPLLPRREARTPTSRADRIRTPGRRPMTHPSFEGEDMKKLLIAATATLLTSLALTPAVHADAPDAQHGSIGLGFHNVAAPVGVRWWLSGQKVGIDLGIGFGNESAIDFGYPDEKISHWALDAGVPFVIHSWDRAHVILRPGLLYKSQEVPVTAFPTPLDTENATDLSILGEIEAEIFIVDNVSVSASHGIAFESFNPPGPGDSQSSFTTFGNNFTQVGFHVYFLGSR